MSKYEQEMIDIGRDYINNHIQSVEQAMLALSELERYRDVPGMPRIEDCLWPIYRRLQQADAAGEILKKYLGKIDV